MKTTSSLLLVFFLCVSNALVKGESGDAVASRPLEEVGESGAKTVAPQAGISALLVQCEHPMRIIIADALPDGVAQRAGLKSKDEILQIDSTAIENMDLFQVYSLLRGAPGSIVKLTVKREGVDDLLHFEIQRELAKPSSGKELSATEASLVGKWKDQYSVYQFNADGTAIDDRPGMHLSGHWVLEEGVLKFIPPVYTGLLPSQHRMIRVTADELVLLGLRSGQTFNFKRVQ